MIADDRLIDEFTALGPVPLVPEIRLWLAGDPAPLWQATQDRSDARGGAGVDVPPPFWAFAWPGGAAIARHVLDHPELVRGRRVLDLGCGSGLQAIAAARAGAARVDANDVDPLALAATRRNAGANAVAVTPLVGDLLGGPAREERWDVVLAGDVCYEPAMAAAMVAWLRTRAAAGALVVLADPGRRYAPAGEPGLLATYDVPVDPLLESTAMKRTTLWRL